MHVDGTSATVPYSTVHERYIDSKAKDLQHPDEGAFDYTTDAELLELEKFAMTVEGYKQMDERLKFDRVPPSKQKLGKRRWNISSEY